MPTMLKRKGMGRLGTCIYNYECRAQESMALDCNEQKFLKETKKVRRKEMSNEQREPASDFDLQIKARNSEALERANAKSVGQHFNKLEQVSLIANEASINNSRISEETQNKQATPATICSQPATRDELPQV
ncbi:4850_t:CDS:2 [Gigaspora rosea]|nr:4850_t:CDS:2 [Gigaspora rosea]